MEIHPLGDWRFILEIRCRSTPIHVPTPVGLLKIHCWHSQSFCESFMTQLSRYIDVSTDVPLEMGDIGVGGRKIGFMYGQTTGGCGIWYVQDVLPLATLIPALLSSLHFTYFLTSP
eukprot:scaffold342211_cov116-Cyclotella_meneghiniana.AAC.1